MKNYTKKQFFGNIFGISKAVLLFTFLINSTLAFSSSRNSSEIMDITQKIEETKITLKMENSSVNHILTEIQKTTKINFGFDNGLKSENMGHFTLNVKDVEVKVALEELFKNTSYTYKVVEDVVIVTRRIKQTQTKEGWEIKGKVLDESGKPVVGATVLIQKSDVGAITDANGAFIIDVKEGDVVEFSSTAYIGQVQVIVAGMKELNVVLKAEEVAMDDVMVVAYGTTTKRSTTGSIASVKAEDLEGLVSPSVAGMLQGRVAGMDVTNISGSPGGSGTAITIRGYNSFDAELERRFSNPLWIVDGVPMNTFTSPVTGTNMLSDLNPDAIESIQVLKDASAAAIYGSRAANGVIIVTTKQGKKNQKATLQVNVSQSLSYIPTLPTITIGKGEAQFRIEALQNRPGAILDKETNEWREPVDNRELYEKYRPDAWTDYFNRPGAIEYGNGLPLQDSLNSFYNNATNFFPMYYDLGHVTNANVQVLGGTEKMNYGIGAGYYNEEGIVIGSGYNRLNLNTNLTVRPTDKVMVDARIYLSYADRSRGAASGNYIEAVPGDPYELSSLLPGEGSAVWDMILEELNKVVDKNTDFRMRGSLKIGYDITKDLNISSIVSTDLALSRNNNFTHSSLDSYYGFSNSTQRQSLTTMFLNENFITYNKKFAKHHSLNFLGGFSIQNDTYDGFNGYALNGPSDDIYYAPEGMPDYILNDNGEVVPLKEFITDFEESSLVSMFARLEYNFKDNYYASISYRRDGSSVFGKNNKWANFPSVAAAWVFSDENFMAGTKGWLDFGKLRTSWGMSGNIFSNTYLAQGILEVGASSNLGNATLVPDWSNGLYNEDLSWEETTQTDIGVDLEMFGRRLSVTADYYHRYTKDLLSVVVLPGFGSYTGYVQQWRNSGSILNTGYELTIGYEFIREADMYFRTMLTFADNRNSLIDTYNGEDFDEYSVIGKPLNGIYGYETNGIAQTNDDIPYYYSARSGNHYLSPSGQYFAQYRAGDYIYTDANGDGVIDSNSDKIYLGSALPTISGGILFDFKWKNFDANVVLSYQLGRHIYNTGKTSSLGTFQGTPLLPLIADINEIDTWSETNTDAVYQKNFLDDTGRWRDPIDLFVEKVNMLKISNVVLGYNLSRSLTSKLGVKKARLFVSGENLLELSNYSGISAETVSIASGIDNGKNYPLARRFTLGLSIDF